MVEEPWLNEADKEDWTEGVVPCAIRRTGELGHLCGYVGLPMDSPLAGLADDDLPVRVHGGLTYASEGGDFLAKGFYWFGFDCAHAGDLIPKSLEWGHSRGDRETYRTIAYVRGETQGLAWDIERLDKLVRKLIACALAKQAAEEAS